MNVVIDTNVLVSGLLGLYTHPARIVDLVYIGDLICIYDDRILHEYQEVLARPKFENIISTRERKDLLYYIALTGVHTLAGPLEKYTPMAPDPEDLPFVEAAVAARADAIVTGNHDHFSFFAENPWGIQILSPRQCYQRVCNK
jgi:putative PIN family toxin of toxin-antitoxin system